jgi:hypothetical protein
MNCFFGKGRGSRERRFVQHERNLVDLWPNTGQAKAKDELSKLRDTLTDCLQIRPDRKIFN